MSTPQIRAQRALDIEAAVITMAMTAFAESLKGQDPPELDDLTVRKLRREYALPIALGMLRAAAKFVWVTAPPGGTMADLIRTMETNIEVVANEVVSGNFPAGEYWITASAGQGAHR